MIRPSLAERYDANGRLTTAGEAALDLANLAAVVATFKPGDVVFDEERPGLLGIVTDARSIGMDITWEDGTGSSGVRVVLSTWHREPRVNVAVTKGMRRGPAEHRARSVKAALRKAFVR